MTPRHAAAEREDDAGTGAPPSGDGEPGVFDGEVVAFTGTLASMTHAAAAELVADLGGTFSEKLTHATTLLVVGEEGWPLADDGAPTVKFRRAAEWNRAGEASVRLLAESEWLRAAGLGGRDGDLSAGVRRLYTPAMLSRLLDVTPGKVRRWAREGLIRPVRTVHRLPYFDFSQVARTRTLARLLEAGVPRAELEAGLAALEQVFGADAASVRLDLLARDGRLLVRDAAGLREPRTGQRVLDFLPGPDAAAAGAVGGEPDSPALLRLPDPEAPADRRTAADWFRLGLDRADADDPAAAVPCFRACLARDPANAEAHFHLADALFRAGEPGAAAERYRAATEHDPRYVEAWVNLGVVRSGGGEHRAAAAAFRTALAIHDDLPDARLHLAESLHALGETAEAAGHYRAYLAHDDRGPWAQLAKARLGEAGNVR